ncbi:MAG TPA: hypothetical protein VK447_18525 [Myxococcaceae bacterium]|nr:hypothetical protein [Myxococcaceae bacterium]
MSADRDIDQWFTEVGLSLPVSRSRLREALEAEGLTRAGKKRISDEKLPKLSALLQERFYRHCGSPDCHKVALGSGREPLQADKKSCERCGGSDNHRAGVELLEAFRRTGLRKLLVVGGSPSVREELIEQLAGEIELRMIDGTERRTGDRAKADLDWADLVLIWGASELHHKVSLLYTQAPHPQRKKVVLVPKRGVAALLAAGVEHLRRI